MLVGLRGSGEQMEISYSFMQREARESEGGVSGNRRIPQRGIKKKREKGGACERHPVLKAVIVLPNKLFVR